MVGWFAVFLISLAINVVAYMIMPRPKQPTPEAAKQLDNPVAEAGKPLGVVQGTVTISDLNVLMFGEKSIRTYRIKV